MKRKSLELIFFAFYTILIFALSSVPGRDIPSQVSSYSFILHFFLYFFYGISILLAIGKFWYSYMFGVLYALSDEIHQYFVPGRTCDPRDFLVDSIGLLVGMLILMFLRGKIFLFRED